MRPVSTPASPWPRAPRQAWPPVERTAPVPRLRPRRETPPLRRRTHASRSSSGEVYTAPRGQISIRAFWRHVSPDVIETRKTRSDPSFFQLLVQLADEPVRRLRRGPGHLGVEIRGHFCGNHLFLGL